MAEASPWIVDVTSETFEQDVIERSASVPVVIDFWAPWCGPCRQLAPLLEQLAIEHDGKFVLVKINIDECQELASAFRVQSIPFVVAMRDRQMVNQFMGILPEPQLREWLQTILPTPIDEMLIQGEAIEGSDPQAAEANYRAALELDPTNAAVKIHLARLCLANDRSDESRLLIEELEARGFLEPEAERIKAQLDLESSAEGSKDVGAARKAVEATPDDLSLQLKLADVLAVDRQYEEALQICLSLVQQDKVGIGAEAKTTMVRIFELLGPESELVGTYRRQLATALY